MNTIYTFSWKDQDIDLTYRNGHLAYTFLKGKESYGIKVKVKSRSVMDIAGATFQLLTNAIETIDKLNEPSRE